MEVGEGFLVTEARHGKPNRNRFALSHGIGRSLQSEFSQPGAEAAGRGGTEGGVFAPRGEIALLSSRWVGGATSDH